MKPKSTSPHQTDDSCLSKGTDTPQELQPLLLPEKDITYPDTPEWHNIGAAAREKFSFRRKTRRSLRVIRFLAAAASVGIIAIAASLLLRSSPLEKGGAYAAGKQAPPDPTAAALADIHSIVEQFELDYLALELVRSGTVRRDETRCVDQILESYDIDAVEVFLASRRVL